MWRHLQAATLGLGQETRLEIHFCESRGHVSVLVSKAYRSREFEYRKEMVQ